MLSRLKKTLWYLPNLLTLLNLFAGFFSLLMAANGRYHEAAWLIVFSLVWDSLDGNIARIFKVSTQMGRELDSLADVVSFVTAPAFLMARVLVHHGGLWTLFFVILYLGAGTCRLARFNVRPPVKNCFEGLPTPAAAVTLVMFFLSYLKDGGTDNSLFTFLAVTFLALLSFLMTSRVRYPKLSAVPFRSWRTHFYFALALLVLLGITVNLETAFAAVFFVFLILAPTVNLQAASPGSHTLLSPHKLS